MRTLIYAGVIAVVIGAILAPILAGLLGLAGMASSPFVRTWFFAFPETLAGMAGDENPGLLALIAGWTLESVPVGVIVAWLMQVRARRNATDRAAAFDQAVTTFHDGAEYDEDDLRHVPRAKPAAATHDEDLEAEYE